MGGIIQNFFGVIFGVIEKLWVIFAKITLSNVPNASTHLHPVSMAWAQVHTSDARESCPDVLSCDTIYNMYTICETWTCN